MREIKLNCFAQNEICQITSDLRSFSLSSPTENQYSLEIANQSENNCSVDLELKKINQSDNLSKVNLMIVKEKELFFQDSLEIFFKQKISLGQIKNKATNKYLLTFDFAGLYLENKKLILDFDFLLNFHCVNQNEQSSKFLNQMDSNINQKENKFEVLSAVDDANKIVQVENNSFLSSPIFYLLSSLFIIVFFVIIKFVNGKKKKNKQ